MTIAIGVAGQKRYGKDVLCDRLCPQIQEKHQWKRDAFANKVKEIFCETFNVTREFVEKWKVVDEIPPGFDMSVRDGLKFIGDGFRQIKGDIWIEILFRDDLYKVISDVRYVNEFVKIKKEKGFNILIGRPDKLNDDPSGSEAQIRPYVVWCLENLPKEKKIVDLRNFNYDGYPSPPPYMDLFDIFIRNDQGLLELYDLIDNQITPIIKESY